MKSEEIFKEKGVLRQIVKASDAIRRKHKMLKSGREANEQAMQVAFKPIVEPLEKLVRSSDTVSNHDKTPVKNEVQGKIKDEIKDEMKKLIKNNREDWGESSNSKVKTKDVDDDDNNDGDDDNNEGMNSSFKSVDEDDSDFDDNAVGNNTADEIMVKSGAEEDDLINKYLKLLRSDKKTTLDCSYGVRRLANGKFMIGDTPIEFKTTSINVGDARYDKTIGLIELLFKKEPDDTHMGISDLDNYKTIVLQTNAHKKYYKADEAIRTSNSVKFDYYIPKSFVNPKRTGKGMPKYKVVKNDIRMDYVYWDDPNELVNRLRLLLASQAAGNSSHTNEILSIIEELREAQIIY